MESYSGFWNQRERISVNWGNLNKDYSFEKCIKTREDVNTGEGWVESI